MREKPYLQQRYGAILACVGLMLLLCAALMAVPLLLLLAYPQEAPQALAFGLPAAGLALLGITLWRVFRSERMATLSVQEGGIVVLIGWLAVILFSAWPFVATLGLPFSKALFESVSGWTTTGLSVVDVTRAGPLILFWRSTIQLAGGAGLAIIMMSAIVGPVGVGISQAEGHQEQLVPQVRQSARWVLLIYACYAAGGTLAYWMAGMTPFDALNHAFAAVSTGGFSTRPQSIGYWNSVAVEAVSLSLMLLGQLSFVTAWFLWRGQWRRVARNGEIRLLLVLLPLAVATLFFLTVRTGHPTLGQGIRVAVFETVSALTTTGFTTVNESRWNAPGLLLLIVLMMIGGGTCSTAGGIKQLRVYLLGKQLLWDLRRQFLPRTAVVENAVWEGTRPLFVDDGKLRQVSTFVLLYLLSYGAGVLVLGACGFGLEEALFEFASALSTVGLSVGVTSADMPEAALWAQMLAMFLGRLEFTVVIVSVLRLFRDGRVIFGGDHRKSGCAQGGRSLTMPADDR